jgi:hypothetical protein
MLYRRQNTIHHLFLRCIVLPMIDAGNEGVSALRLHPNAIGAFDGMSDRKSPESLSNTN